MKEQENSPEKGLDEMEANNLSDIEFRVMIIRILNSMKKDIEIIKRPARNKKCISLRGNNYSCPTLWCLNHASSFTSEKYNWKTFTL